MAVNQLRQQIEQISREKNINPDVIIAAIEDAILTASKKYYKNDEDLRSRFNGESGLIEVFAVKQIVEAVDNPATQISLDEAHKLIPEAEVGQEIEFPKPTDILGRIAAQTAKQVIFQKVREAERDNVFAEYSGRVNEVVNGIIKRQEMGDFVVDLGRTEAILPRKEQSRAETYQTGDRVRVAIVKVLKSAKGPQVVVSRTDPALLIKLFEMEVPEIYDGTVQIRGCVREAGERAKVAVVSREKDVDPVGACVGMKGTRVQSIIRELRGEKIDIVEWNEDAVVFVEKALSPAKISRVTIVDEEQKIMEVVVEDKQLSLAIGKKGQNVRLAAKLVGWRIDIKSEEEKRQEVEAEMARMQRIVEELRSLEGVGDKTIQKLIDVGVGGLDHLLSMTDEEMTTIEGIGPKTAEKIRESATSAKQEWDRRDAETARLEAERLAAEQAAAEQAAAEEEARRQAEEQAAAEAEAAAAASAAAEGEPASVGEGAGEDPGQGGKPDGER
jgi:N utilization substance protein A